MNSTLTPISYVVWWKTQQLNRSPQICKPEYQLKQTVTGGLGFTSSNIQLMINDTGADQ
jgi:hypothetical protein